MPVHVKSITYERIVSGETLDNAKNLNIEYNEYNFQIKRGENYEK